MTGGVDMWRMRLLRRFMLSVIKVIDRAAPRNDKGVVVYGKRLIRRFILCTIKVIDRATPQKVARTTQ
jgi:hypothetical protein